MLKYRSDEFTIALTAKLVAQLNAVEALEAEESWDKSTSSDRRREIVSISQWRQDWLKKLKEPRDLGYLVNFMYYALRFEDEFIDILKEVLESLKV